MRFWAHFEMHPRDVDRLMWDERETFRQVMDARDRGR